MPPVLAGPRYGHARLFQRAIFSGRRPRVGSHSNIIATKWCSRLDQCQPNAVAKFIIQLRQAIGVTHSQLVESVSIPLVDVAKQNRSLEGEIREALDRVLAQGDFIL